MKYRNVGKWGIKVSEIALGAWTTYGDSVEDLSVIKKITQVAYEGGVNFFDNADVYALGKGEQVMGRVLADYPRHTLVMSSKVYWPMSDDVNDRGLSRKHIRESIDNSLRNLKTDYLDLYFAHRHDDSVPMEEIVTTFSGLVDSGKITYWGTSEWPADRIAEAVAFANDNAFHPPIVDQPQYSMLHRERVENEVMPVTDAAGMGLVVWSPLAMGMLTGKYDDGLPDGARLSDNDGFRERILSDANRTKVKDLLEIADGLNASRAQLALAWVLRTKAVSAAITGATRPEQIAETIGATSVNLNDDTVARIEAILAGD